MKKLSAIFVGIVLATLCQLALAAPAVVSGLTGTAHAIPGAGAPRTLRIGDDVNQGETVATGENSSIVLRFEDGQVVALTARSRMAVNAYTYNRTEPASSNVLLSLLDGGMRAITGLIGRRDPTKVSYRAGNATIGIRGTDVTLVTAAGNVVVTVNDGSISFAFSGQTITVTAGQGVNAKTDGTFQAAAAAQIQQQLQQTPQGQQMLNSINGLQGLAAAISAAAAPAGTTGPQAGAATSSTPGPTGPTSGSGGGTASGR